jgi:hypothetical protein
MSLALQADDVEEQLLARALYVEDDDGDAGVDESLPPTTGQEYLRRVMREAKKVEDVCVG